MKAKPMKAWAVIDKRGRFLAEAIFPNKVSADYYRDYFGLEKVIRVLITPIAKAGK